MIYLPQVPTESSERSYCLNLYRYAAVKLLLQTARVSRCRIPYCTHGTGVYPLLINVPYLALTVGPNQTRTGPLLQGKLWVTANRQALQALR